MNAKAGKISQEAQVVRYVVFGTLLVLIIFLIVAQFAVPAGRGARDATAALTLIAGAAIAIERILEGFWTFMSMTRGSKWPLGPLSDQFSAMTSNLHATLAPFHQEAEAALKRLGQTQQWTQQQLDAALVELKQVEAKVREIRTLQPDSQKVELVAASTSQIIGYIDQKYNDPQLKAYAKLAGDSLKGVSDLVASFKDNPGRRLISIFLGSSLGMVIAGVMGLDVFQATLAPETVGAAQVGAQNLIRFLPYAGVAVTGLVIGLGSDPTHQVIEVLKKYKEGRKAASAG